MQTHHIAIDFIVKYTLNLYVIFQNDAIVVKFIQTNCLQYYK